MRKSARIFRIKLTGDEAAAYRDAWRAANPEIVRFWTGLESAAYQTVADGQPHSFRGVEFTMRAGNLTMALPSGRRLVYWKPSLKLAELPWGDRTYQIHYWAENSYTRRWEEHKAYGGLFTENLVQAASRDLMADAFLRAKHLNPVLTVHDEIVCEVSRDDFPDPEEAAKG